MFDTGSPTLLDCALAEELDLEIVDRVTGTDAPGAKAAELHVFGYSFTLYCGP